MNQPHTPAAVVESPAAAVQQASAAMHPMSVGPRTADELTVRLPDGIEVFYRHWPARSAGSRDCVALFHRGHEHSGRLQHVVDELDLPDAHFVAWDARGHGRSPGPPEDRGYAPSYGQMIRDVDAFVTAVSRRHDLPIDRMAVLAHSVGAVSVAAWVHDYNPPIRGMVLVTPALRVRLYVPLAIPSLRLMSKIKPRFNVRSYVKGKLLTHDAEAAAAYDADPLVSRNIAVNVLLGLHDTATRLLDDADAIVTPTLVLAAGSDWVVDNRATRRFFDGLSSPVKSMKTYEGKYHALLHEADRAAPIADTRAFLVARFADDAPPMPRTPQPRPRAAERYAQLRRPAPLWQKPWWAAQRIGLRLLRPLSRGIAIGFSDGFDSGRSLDHVYRHTPAGFGPLGRLVDRIYLDAPGWRGIRQRKANMHAALTEALSDVLSRRWGAHVVDIASGPGRYLLDVLAEPEFAAVTAALRDRDEAGLAAGRALAADMRLAERVTYETGDAFNESALSRIEPRPDVAIVSGLYELFSDNAAITRSLRGLHAAVNDGGYLIYTNQPWHPQLGMIARTLPNRDGDRWVMRCRSQHEIDALVAAAGFTKLATRADDDGIFTVSIARRGGIA